MAQKNQLYKDFTAPPFSIMDGRCGWWRTRKHRWIDLGIQSELGRKPTMSSLASSYRAMLKMEGKTINEIPAWTTTSIFDPVLTELMYRWFSPMDGNILDPYAGGSVRGIVASYLHRHYTGLELRAEQVSANQEQAASLCKSHRPKWRAADSVRLKQVTAQTYDFIFTCPPYGSLEVYSDDPRDISTMPYDVFIGALKHNMKTVIKRLKNDRFMALVVGEFRDQKGLYQGFIADVIKAIEEGGGRYYNEAVFLQSTGTLAIRIRSQFTKSRKLGKSHQNVLIFVKGDPRKATDHINQCNANDIQLFDDES